MDERNQAYADKLSRMIRLETVSDYGQPENEKFSAFQRLLEELFPHLFAACSKRDFRGSLLLHWPGRDKDAEPVLFLNHMDVVEAGDGWTKPPFDAVIENGRMYGRGTNDDKGPSLAALFAMRAVRDAGIPLKKSIRMILGCDEESGWEDMEYYGTHERIPDVGFSPDANFPLINTEKGMLVDGKPVEGHTIPLTDAPRCRVVVTI